jgi:phosphate transport system substrate-binding protein
MKKLMLVMLSAFFLAAVSGPALAEKAVVQVKGSDTIVHLVSSLAESFMKVHPEIEIAVTGGGSGTGISALLNGTTDIANSSRPMSVSEKSKTKGRGFEAYENVIGQDGLSVIVNPSNPVKTLTLEQVKQIYTGEVNNWKAFGGPDAKIGVISRDSSSGTFVFFQEHVLRKMDYSVKARRLPSTSAIIQTVSEDVNAIGYVGLGYLAEAQGKVKSLPIAKKEGSTPVMPSNATVLDGTYPISRPLFMYTRNQPEGNVKVFIDFVMSPEGQKIVEDMGFVRKK